MGPASYCPGDTDQSRTLPSSFGVQRVKVSNNCLTIMGSWIFSIVVVLLVQLRASSAEDAAAYPSSILETQAPLSCDMSLKSLVVDATGLQRQIDELATFSDTPSPSVTRILYTENDVAARRYIRNAMQSVGLTVREDAIGNIFGRWEGSEQTGAVGTGSHIDAIPNAGKYDGTIGVLGAIEAIRTLKKYILIRTLWAGFIPKKPLEVIMFTSEEPTRFGFGCLGSRAMAGSENILQILRESIDRDNVTFSEAAKQAGYLHQEEDLETVAVSNEMYSGFVELHIEQGPTLEDERIQIGIVTAIAAPASLKVDFKGDGGHAGAVLMPFRPIDVHYVIHRNDVGLVAAELALAVEEHVLASGSIDTVGTTGIVELYPGAVNSIPRQAHLEIDIRDIDGKRRDDVVEKIRRSALTIAERRNAQVTNFQIVNQDPPAQSGDNILQAVVSASEELGFRHKFMKSRAYHDSTFMARVCPMSMIFIPCYKGYSHRPDEHSRLEDIVRGVQVLALTLSKLSLT